MKRLVLTLSVLLMAATSMVAMSYETAREHALYLTDKMAYELDLNEEQYEYAYEINLDYLMGLNTINDIDGAYLRYRNADFQHILYDWQWRRFMATSYFFRPILWRSGAWYYPIYSYYRHDHWYYSRPGFYYSYRGGHGRDHFHSGYYYQRRPSWAHGMRSGDRGYVNNGYRGGRSDHGGMNNRSDRGFNDTSRGGRPNTDKGRGNINRSENTFRFSNSERTYERTNTTPNIKMDRNATGSYNQNRGIGTVHGSRGGSNFGGASRGSSSTYSGSHGGSRFGGGSHSGTMHNGHGSRR